jgi:hypothetical protein
MFLFSFVISILFLFIVSLCGEPLHLSKDSFVNGVASLRARQDYFVNQTIDISDLRKITLTGLADTGKQIHRRLFALLANRFVVRLNLSIIALIFAHFQSSFLKLNHFLQIKCSCVLSSASLFHFFETRQFAGSKN